MKLKKAESEMLPVWVLSGVYTKPFFAWLNEAGESNTWEHQNNTVVKMRQGNFIYLYLQKGAGKNLVPGHDLKFAGLFVRKNYNLYDVDMELAVLLGLPEEIGFPCRIDIRREAEERASQKADEILEMHWQEFLFQSGLDTKSLIPLVVRSEIRERAERTIICRAGILLISNSYRRFLWRHLFPIPRTCCSWNMESRWQKRLQSGGSNGILRIFRSSEFFSVVCGMNSGKF